MPRFRVTFPSVVIYLPDHPKGNRPVTELIVSAPDARSAEIHAFRVVRGSVSYVEVTPVDGPLGPAPVVEVPHDTPLVFRV